MGGMKLVFMCFPTPRFTIFFSRIFQGLLLFVLLICWASPIRSASGLPPICYLCCHHRGPKHHHSLPGKLWYFLTGLTGAAILASLLPTTPRRHREIAFLSQNLPVTSSHRCSEIQTSAVTEKGVGDEISEKPNAPIPFPTTAYSALLTLTFLLFTEHAKLVLNLRPSYVVFLCLE